MKEIKTSVKQRVCDVQLERGSIENNCASLTHERESSRAH